MVSCFVLQRRARLTHSGNQFVNARLICAVASEGYLPKLFSKLHASRHTPVNAVLLQTALGMAMLLFGNFRTLLVFSSVCAWSFLFLTVFSLLVLRVKEPDLARCVCLASATGSHAAQTVQDMADRANVSD
jgi:amino acid transporter